MNFSSRTKAELCKINYESGCCKLAALSAFIRTAGSIISENEVYGFCVTAQPECVEYFARLIKELFSESAEFNYSSKSAEKSANTSDKKAAFIGKKGKEKKIPVGFSLISSKSTDILIELGIFKILNGELVISLEPESYLTENDCCKKAYVAGAFMGSGSVTVPNADGERASSTGYHLEFVFSKYLTAAAFSELLCEQGFLPKLIDRKENYVVYFKQNEEIKDILAFMGAQKSVIALADLVVLRNVKNNINRTNNCEYHNISRQIDASLKTCAAIKTIETTVGLDVLPEELKETAIARAQKSDLTLNELAESLGVSKSCLNHRLRKINKIAESLK